MIVRTSTARYSGSGTRFLVHTGTGHEVVLDDDAGDSGARPVEMLLVGQVGCTGFDVIGSLREAGQVVTRYEVAVTAEQRDEAQPAIYTRAIVMHEVEGPSPDEQQLRRAIYESATKYSSVAAMLSASTVEIHHRYRIVRPGVAPIEGEVLVTGPNADPDRLGESSANERGGVA
ncbi:MAG: OsmC family protein [Candidatus Limnocylindrales bacterium]|jgi:putative redox protein